MMSMDDLDDVFRYFEDLNPVRLRLKISMPVFEQLNAVSKENPIRNKLNSVKCLGILNSEGLFNATRDSLDLKQFMNLEDLEINKIDYSDIEWCSNVKNTLRQFKCIFSHATALTFLISIQRETNVWCSLTSLKLSHCKIQEIDTQILARMPYLKHIDLSYNRLTSLDINQNLILTHLVLSFNRLETVPSLNKIKKSQLEILLLNDNLISDLGFSNFKYMENVQKLNLANNLLFDTDCLKEISGLFLLHELVLDGNPLSSSRDYRIFVAKHLNENASIYHFLLDNTPLSEKEKIHVGSLSLSSDSSWIEVNEDSIESNPECASLDVSGCSTQQSTSRLKKRPSSRNVPIDECRCPPQIEKIKTSQLHLELKAQIENLRCHFGQDNWLHQEAGSTLQNILGLPNPTQESSNQDASFETTSNSSVSVSPSPKFISDALRSEEISTVSEVKSVSEKEEELKLVLPDILDSHVITLDSSQGAAVQPEDYDCSRYFPAMRECDSKEVFLECANGHFTETETSFCEGIIFWPLKHMLSCSPLKTTRDNTFSKVMLTFGPPIPVQNRERVYSMEYKEAESLCSLVREELDKRSLNKTTYECIRCSEVFSVEKKDEYKLEFVQCKTCGSNAVLESLLTPQNGERCTKKESEFIKSPSQSSIGSANSLKTLQDTVKSLKYDSDIEIISNPSQSSVEILQEVPNKMEEPINLPRVLEFLTPPEQNGLTESSSSGSQTDSICTSYDAGRRQTVFTSKLYDGQDEPGQWLVKNTTELVSQNGNEK